MATASTLATIIAQVADEMGVGTVLTGLTGTTTTLTDATAGLAGKSRSASRFPLGSLVLITAGGTPGDVSLVAGYVPSTGVITLDPAITTGATAAIVITEDGIDKASRIQEAINRALLNRLMTPHKSPLTFVPDGDLRGATVTDFWTGTSATPTYVSTSWPAAGAAAFGFIDAKTVLQSVTSNATNSVKSNAIDTVLTNTYQWYFQTSIRVVSGTGNAQLIFYDETNSANVTAAFTAGTGTTSSNGFVNQEGMVTFPTTCKQFTVRLVSNATTTTLQMAPVNMAPADARVYPIPRRVITPSYIGNFWYKASHSSEGGPYSAAWRGPITVGGRTHHIDDQMDHYTVTFNFQPVGAVWYDEFGGDVALATMAATTSFNLDYVVKGAKWELAKFLYSREKRMRLETGAPVPPLWKGKVIEYRREFDGCDYEPETIQITGRV